jgi:hypothetical protein
MHDKLIGYLLDSLEPGEKQRVAEALEREPRLRQQLRLAGEGLQILKLDREEIEPPAGLGERTCQFVDSSMRIRRPPERELAESSSSWSLADLCIAAGIALASALLIIPALTNSRNHARLAGCQNNLRQLGQALVGYADSFQGRFPRIPDTGNLAVAGSYAVTLSELGLITDDGVFHCPASLGGDEARARPIPTRFEVQSASGDELHALQRLLGGHFGYNMGYLDHGRLQSVRNRGRDCYPLMSDAPVRMGSATQASRNHGVHGQNVLFESGRVQVVPRDSVIWNSDAMFLNDAGRVEAGLHAADAVIGASAASPLPAAVRAPR